MKDRLLYVDNIDLDTLKTASFLNLLIFTKNNSKRLIQPTMSQLKIPKKVFMPGGIPAAFIATSIAKHQSKTDIGAHNIFLGQVRADVIEGKTVKAIEYSAYEEMATEQLHQIREVTFDKFPITCMHIHHSMGAVAAGEICLFVFVSSPHRDVCYQASRYIVEAIKKEVPIFGKEIFEDESHQWKENR